MSKNIHPFAVWEDIKEQIELSIIDGTFKSTDRMPSIAEFARQYDCSKSTVQKVLNELVNEGIIVTRTGIGCFVKPFVQGKLKEQHRTKLNKELEHGICTARHMGVGLEDLKKIIEKEIAKIYSP